MRREDFEGRKLVGGVLREFLNEVKRVRVEVVIIGREEWDVRYI